MRDRIDLFLVSALVLFLELACIRWFPAHVVFLTFFTNTVLLACFLGMSVGCLAASRRQNFLAWTPLLLALALGAAQWVDFERHRGQLVDVGHQLSPQMVFFGTEYGLGDPSVFVVPIEVVLAFFFVIVALALVGPGQQLGRSLARVPNRVEAYSVNVAGSIAGIVIFTACSWWQLGPVYWFGAAIAALGYLVSPRTLMRALAFGVPSAAVLLLASSNGDVVGRANTGVRTLWSPYYRIDYQESRRQISVNLIGHQEMSSRAWPSAPAYALPYLFNRDSGGSPFAQVLVIGGGSGNDVSRALAWGAERVDVVEIDPVIQRLGARDHPDRPYSDPRVFVHLGDGRNFLKSTNKQYDLIVYALVDSLVLHSSYSHIRLESYLFTKEALADIRHRLRPGGLFVMYNYFRQGWIVARLEAMLEDAFGKGNPLIFNLPSRDTIRPDDVLFGEFTLFFAGATAPMREAFARHGAFVMPADHPDPTAPNGFTLRADPARPTLQFRPTTVVPPSDPLVLATDAWPFLYLRNPMIPALSVRGMAIMGTLALLFVLPFVRRRSPKAPSGAGDRAAGTASMARMFFLGAGFMLIETKAVVQMALLFGSTWIVNSVVFCAVLVMILAANLFVLSRRPRSLAPFYAGLFATLALNAVVPMDAFLGLSRELQILASCLLAFTPIFFAGVVFSVSFDRSTDADRAFGFNIAGAIAGGLSEYTSMLIGFQFIVLVALAFYVLSAWARRRHAAVSLDAALPA